MIPPSPSTTPASTPWLTIVGIGMDGIAGLVPAAREAIERAELVIGSSRQLTLVRSLAQREVMVWPSPLADGVAKLWARRGRATCVLASGDPFFFGIGATLAPGLTAGEFVCHPAPSSVSLAAARLGWALQHTDVVSLHGRDLQNVIRYLQPGRRVLALSWNRDTPAQLAELLRGRGFGSSRLHVLEALGGSEERVRSCRAESFDLSEVLDLNVIGLEAEAEGAAGVIPWRASLPDASFEHDGQLTKQDIRAITLSALAPRAGEVLWDVGAGAGSIGIEWMLAHPTCRTFAIEADPVRCERIRRNALGLGVPALSILNARAPAGLDALPQPDAVFVGGGAGEPGVFECVWRALRSGGRLVINAVALETAALLFEWQARHGGELRRITIESSVPLGRMRGFRPAMPVTQWRVAKP